MSIHGLDPGEDCNDPKVLRELIDLLKQMVVAQKGMNHANRKIITAQEQIIQQQEDKIELLKGIGETLRDRVMLYEEAFSAAHHNNVRRLN